MMDNKEKDLYVRTRYGEIYRVYSTDVDGVDYLVYNHEYDGVDEWSSKFYEYSKKEIVKESENIEDLCDKFIIIDKKTRIPDERFEIQFTSLKEAKKRYAKAIDILVGAIWTHKGLKYVAQMNNKGELELLWIDWLKRISLIHIMK